MNFSAAVSSALVVTPGRALAASIRRQRTRIWPEAAILSTCSGVFLMIMRYTLAVRRRFLDRLVGFQLQRGERAAQLIGHRVRGGAAVDPPQPALVVVKLDQR